MNTEKTSRLVLQVWISDKSIPPLVRLSIERAVHYAARQGADYHLVSQLSQDVPPHFGIVEAYGFDYDKIFYLDCDAVIMDECPDIFEFEEISAVADVDLRGSHAPEDYNQEVKERFGIPREHIYFNSGVVLFTRAFLDQTRDWVAANLPRHIPQRSQWDQSLLNEAVAKHGGRYHMLGADWNAWYRPRDAKYIQHYAAWQRGQFDEARVRSLLE